MKKKWVKYLRESEALSVFKQILSGIKEFLKYEIVHRDLKMANIFINKDKLLIGDFGMAKIGN